jgi:hypothetical protein
MIPALWHLTAHDTPFVIDYSYLSPRHTFSFWVTSVKVFFPAEGDFPQQGLLLTFLLAYLKFVISFHLRPKCRDSTFVHLKLAGGRKLLSSTVYLQSPKSRGNCGLLNPDYSSS